MFDRDPKKRPTIDEIKSHPWLKKPFDADEARIHIISELIEKDWDISMFDKSISSQIQTNKHKTTPVKNTSQLMC